MKTINPLARICFLAVCIIPMLCGCAAKKNTYGDARKGYNLQYRMPKGQPSQYDLVSSYVSTMKIMEREIEVKNDSRNLFTLQPSGMKNGNYLYNVTIDTAFIHFMTMQGEMVPGMNRIIGNDFQLELSPKGKEVDWSGAEELKYKLSESDELNLSGDFQNLFPDLPQGLVRSGESWTTSDTLVEKSKTGILKFFTTNTHMLEGEEPVMGFDCLKIHTTFNGSMAGNGKIQDADTKTTGTLSGEYTWYFAYREGQFVKMSFQGLAESSTMASAPGRDIEIPSSRKFTIETSLVKE